MLRHARRRDQMRAYYYIINFVFHSQPPRLFASFTQEVRDRSCKLAGRPQDERATFVREWKGRETSGEQHGTAGGERLGQLLVFTVMPATGNE